MNHWHERQLVHYMAAHDKALEHQDPKEAARIREIILARYGFRVAKDPGMGRPRIYKV